MISYKDRSFCQSDCLDSTCDRFISKKVLKGALECRLPLCVADFSTRCEDYIKPLENPDG